MHVREAFLTWSQKEIKIFLKFNLIQLLWIAMKSLRQRSTEKIIADLHDIHKHRKSCCSTEDIYLRPDFSAFSFIANTTDEVCTYFSCPACIPFWDSALLMIFAKWVWLKKNCKNKSITIIQGATCLIILVMISNTRVSINDSRHFILRLKA